MLWEKHCFSVWNTLICTKSEIARYSTLAMNCYTQHCRITMCTGHFRVQHHRDLHYPNFVLHPSRQSLWSTYFSDSSKCTCDCSTTFSRTLLSSMLCATLIIRYVHNLSRKQSVSYNWNCSVWYCFVIASAPAMNQHDEI